jgi:hypothetical protein
MAEEKANPVPDPDEDEALELEMVEETFQIKGGANRNEAAGTCTVTGNFKLNTGGSERLDKVAVRRGLTPGAYGVTYGVDVKRGVVAAKAVPSDTPNAMPVRRSDDKQLSIHLGGVFVKYPDLRPVTTSECLVSIRKDSLGHPVLMIALQMSQHKSKSRTSSTGTTPKQGETAG